MLGEVAKKYRKGLLETIKFLKQLHDENLKQEQEVCSHKERTYHSDWSGHNGGYYSCDNCDKVL